MDTSKQRDKNPFAVQMALFNILFDLNLYDTVFRYKQ